MKRKTKEITACVIILSISLGFLTWFLREFWHYPYGGGETPTTVGAEG